MLSFFYTNAKKIVIFVTGFTVILFGIAMLVLPGPGLLVIVGGLGLLGLEFAWARIFLASVKKKAQSGWDKWNTKSS